MVNLIGLYRRDAAQSPFNSAFPSFILIVLLTAVLAILACSIGAEDISFSETVTELFSDEKGTHNFIIQNLRLPRILMALLVGAGLAISGLVLQTLVRNSLASPDIIGITGGASVAVVIYFGWLATKISVVWLPLIASIGSTTSAALIVLLMWRRTIEPARFILIGIGVSATAGALTTLFMVFSTETTNLSAYIWLTGSVYGSNWIDIQQITPWIILPLLPLLMMGRTLNTLLLGESVSTSLGVSIRFVQASALSICIIMASAAVSYAGAIGFVGLLAPHITRRLVKSSLTLQIPASGCVGGMLVLSADTIGRSFAGSLDLPAGIFVSAIGAPFFIYLLYRQR